jgi:hypothetical protein
MIPLDQINHYAIVGDSHAIANKQEYVPARMHDHQESKRYARTLEWSAPVAVAAQKTKRSSTFF